MSSSLADSRIDALTDRARRRGRVSVRTRVGRIRSKAWHIGHVTDLTRSRAT